MSIEAEIAPLAARLLAHRYLPRTDAAVRRVLTDDTYRDELDRRLQAVGLKLLENPYAEHVAVGLMPNAESRVFGGGDTWLSDNQGLPRDGVALLVVLWALIVLPKRERQIARRERNDEQSDMFAAEKPMPVGAAVSPVLSEDALFADFGRQLGGKMRMNTNLGVLARLGFIVRKNKTIGEGPLLDLAIDYARLAPRIIEGTLASVLQAQLDAQAIAEADGGNSDDPDDDAGYAEYGDDAPADGDQPPEPQQ